MFALSGDCSRRTFLRAVAATCTAGALAGCSGAPAQSSSSSASGDTKPKEFSLTVALSEEPAGLDPAFANDFGARQVMAHVYEGLLRFEDESCEVVPCLADLPKVSEDGLTYTFAIKEGVAFHDGTALTAQAVKENIERQIEPNRAEQMFCAPLAFGSAAGQNGVESVEATDQNTLVVKLRAASVSFLSHLAACCVSPIVAPSAFATAIDHPVGTGPYAFGEWKKGAGIELERFDGYWDSQRMDKGLRAQRIAFNIVGDASQRAAALREGKADVALALSSTLRESLSQSGCSLEDVPVATTSYLAFNTASKAFGEEKARIAFAKAIDVPTLVTALYGEEAQYANAILPADAFPFVSTIKQVAYNKEEEAVAELTDLGISKLTLRCLTYKESRVFNAKGGEALANALQAYVASAGITMTIEACAATEYMDRIKSGEYDVCLGGWSGTSGSADDFFRLLTESDPLLNLARFDSKELKELVAKADAQPDEGMRNDLYYQCEQYVSERRPWIPLTHCHMACGQRSNVQGVVYHPTGVVYLQGATKTA